MGTPVNEDSLRRLSVHSLLGRLPPGVKAKSGFIFCMRSRVEAGSDSIHELYFTVHWAVVQSGFLFLFDSSISQSCTEAIWLAGSRLEAAVHQERQLWPPCCTQLFGLTPAGANAATWQLGCPATDGWQLELAKAAAAAAVSAAAFGHSADAALTRLLQQLDGAGAASGNDDMNQYHSVAATSATAAVPDSQEQLAGVEDDGNEYDVCITGVAGGADAHGLHGLASSGGAASFCLDYVAAAVHTGEDADDASLWGLLADSDSGTFLLTGFCHRHPGQPMQIAVKADGFAVKTLPLVLADARSSRVTLIGEHGRTFDCIEHLVFHYHLFPITSSQDGTGVYLTCAYGYDRNSGLPVRTMLFASCLWTMRDKELCSRLLFDSAVGTYSLRTGDNGNYVLSIQSQGVVAKLRVNAATENGRNKFFLASGALSSLWFDSLEELLLRLHRSRFPLVLSKSNVEMTLQTPFQLSSMCRSRLQSQLLEPLRQKIFHRGGERLAEAALTLPSTPAGDFIVWLCAASEVVLMARSDAARGGTAAAVVAKFPIVCEATGCSGHLPQRQFYLTKRPSLRFDSIEALIAHLQCNGGLLAPELSCPLHQPVNCRI